MPLPKTTGLYFSYLTKEEKSLPIYHTTKELMSAVEDVPKNSLSGLVINHCFWQLDNPLAFIEKLETALAAGSNAIFLEPLISPVSFVLHTIKQPNQINIKANPFESSHASIATNIAYSSLVFDRIENRIEFLNRFPHLTFQSRIRMDILAGHLYSITSLQSLVKKWDAITLPFLGNFAACQMKVILKKKPLI